MSSQNNTNILYQKIQENYRIDEETCVVNILEQLKLDPHLKNDIQDQAHDLVQKIRQGRVGKEGIDAFMLQYQLSSEEGIVLMCLAEALLRVPDAATADRLIGDKIGGGDWEEYLGKSHSPFVNASTWALMLTGKVIKYGDHRDDNLSSIFKKLINKSGKPIIRKAIYHAMKILGKQFVLGRNIKEAMNRAKDLEKQGFSYSYDLLGESAKNKDDAKRYFNAYMNAIISIGENSQNHQQDLKPSISIKLTALHPRFEYTKYDLITNELIPSVKLLALKAQEYDMDLTIDAEEAHRFEPTLHVIESLALDPDLKNWNGLGFALQAYQKRALPAIDWTIDLAKRSSKKLKIRLVKGAYWDSEIKMAQEAGLDQYPVFTRKSNTDISYLCCAKKLLENRDFLYPQFATHNAQSVAAIYNFADKDSQGYEFQRLHGMGQALYDNIVGPDKLDLKCRIYAPVGSHEELLPYLVRRLLENGANNSFVNRLVDDRSPIEDIICDPIAKVSRMAKKSHSQIPLPRDLYEKKWTNSYGPDLSDTNVVNKIYDDFDHYLQQKFSVYPIVNGKYIEHGQAKQITNPANKTHEIGEFYDCPPEIIAEAFEISAKAQKNWDKTSADERARCLDKMADIIEEEMNLFMTILTIEGGKTLDDCVSEVREAVDFCRYYATQARDLFGQPIELPGVTGEKNSLSYHGRGVFVCISPWNFPFAIFLGQIAAALVSGNGVIAKPSEQTPIIAFETIKRLHQAGIPKEILHLVTGEGRNIGPILIDNKNLSGVCFTGSGQTAQTINKQLANKSGKITLLIAETGGQNAMIVDSSALIEQTVTDVINSAFQSAGQRCSALRVLYVQCDIADKLIQTLKGAIEELRIGDPLNFSTDIGPIIDQNSLKNLQGHIEEMESKFISHNTNNTLSSELKVGNFLMPHIFEINSITDLKQENFGPILHLIRYESHQLKDVIKEINESDFGLTLGIQSRIQETINYIKDNVEVGNYYVNRNQVGATVGCQPFGGERLSGTGPKAGGPNYLPRFATERVTCVDVTAQGGNTTLLALEEIDLDDEHETPPPQEFIASRFKDNT